MTDSPPEGQAGWLLLIPYNMATNFTHTTRDQQQSRFFRLPAELREDILELAFANDKDLHGAAALISVKPPSNAVLRTCQLAYREGCKHYKTSYRAY